jgi:hypothetical protein
VQRRAAWGLVLTACGPSAWGEPQPLVSVDGWGALAGADPFGAPPPGAVCDPAGFGPEDFAGEPAFDVRTQQCGWLSVAQAANAGLSRTDRLFLRLWHDPLTSGEPGASAHLGLAVEGEVVWTQDVPIPAGGGIVLADLELRRALDEGFELIFHVDNHGSNSYHLLEISRRPAVAPADAVDVGLDP